MLAILDYKAGNQTSVYRALEHLGIPSVITNDIKVLRNAQGIIFPGVGAAGQAMHNLNNTVQNGTSLAQVLKELIAENKPLLGICLGCQILLEHSQENDTQGLGILKGSCLRFDSSLKDAGNHICIPHMGWNSINIKQECPLLKGVEDKSEFYFVHSYYVVADENLVITTTDYGLEFCSMYGRDGLWATQFHLEKSGQAGLQVLKNFYEYCQGK